MLEILVGVAVIALIAAIWFLPVARCRVPGVVDAESDEDRSGPGYVPMQGMRPRERDRSAVDRWRSGSDRSRQREPLSVRFDHGGSKRHWPRDP